MNNFNEGLTKALEFLESGNYEETVERSFKVLESALVMIYNEIFSDLKLEVQLSILNYLKDNFNGKKFSDLMIGEKLKLYDDHKILENRANLHKDINFKQLYSVNSFRVDSAHQKRKLTKGEAYYSFGVILRFLEKIDETINIKLVEETNPIISTIELKNQDKLVLQNLPKRDYIEFIGREEKIEEIITFLMHDKIHVLSIDGIGGVGKSALALEVAYNLLEKKLFDAIIWVSAKRDKLTYKGIIDLNNTFDNLEDLFDEILKVFNENDFLKHGNLTTKENKVLELLKENRSLLIVDNLETINDENLKNFLIDINFPIESKVLVTSRKRLGQVEYVIYLEKFTIDETTKYINSQLSFRKHPRKCSEDLLKDIHTKTGGIPLAIKVIIPWIIEGKLTNQLVGNIDQETDILKFCFDKVYSEFLTQDAKKLFCILSLAPTEINETALRFISELKESEFNESLNSLINYSLIYKSQNEDSKDESFSLLPLTQEFGKKMALHDFTDLKEKINKSYLRFLELSQSEIYTAKRAVSINKAEEARRLFSRGDIENAEILFKESIEYDDDCDYSFYLFAIFSKEKQDYGRATNLIEKAIRLNDGNPFYWTEYASILESSGDFKKAEKVLETALEKTNNNKNIVQRLCLIKTMLNKNEDVISIAEKNIDMNPADKKIIFINTLLTVSLIESYWRLSSAFYKTNNKRKSYDLLFTAVQKLEKYKNKKIIFTDNPKLQWEEKKTYHRLGDIAVQLDNRASALEFYKSSIYNIAYFPDRKNHNSLIKTKIESLKKENS